MIEGTCDKCNHKSRNLELFQEYDPDSGWSDFMVCDRCLKYYMPK